MKQQAVKMKICHDPSACVGMMAEFEELLLNRGNEGALDDDLSTAWAAFTMRRTAMHEVRSCPGQCFIGAMKSRASVNQRDWQPGG